MDQYKYQQQKVTTWFDSDLNSRKRKIKRNVSARAKATFKRKTLKEIEKNLNPE